MSNSEPDDGGTIDGEHPRPQRRMPDEPDDQQENTSDDDRRHAVDDPESPGATIDTDHPAEPNEPA